MSANVEPPPRIDLLGMPIDRVTAAGVGGAVRRGLQSGRGGWIITPNLDQLRLFDRDPEIGELFSSADLVVADGMPLIWASRLQGTPLPERVAGSDLVWSLAALAAEETVGLFLLGGDPGVADVAAEELCRRHPDLRIAGTHCPPFGFEKDPEALAEISAAVASSGAGLVYVGLGFPKQELLIAQLAPECPAAWFIGCGISLSFIAGDVQRAPGWMQATGLEWLHRLTQEPGRLARRYLIHGLPFALKLLAATLRRRLRPNRP